MICLDKKSTKGYSEISTSEFTARRTADNMKANGYDAHVEEIIIKDSKGKSKKVWRVWVKDYP